MSDKEICVTHNGSGLSLTYEELMKLKQIREESATACCDRCGSKKWKSLTLEMYMWCGDCGNKELVQEVCDFTELDDTKRAFVELYHECHENITMEMTAIRLRMFELCRSHSNIIEEIFVDYRHKVVSINLKITNERTGRPVKLGALIGKRGDIINPIKMQLREEFGQSWGVEVLQIDEDE